MNYNKTHLIDEFLHHNKDILLRAHETTIQNFSENRKKMFACLLRCTETLIL